VKDKLTTVWEKKNYIEDGFVRNLTRFFAVPEVEHDIRMVYDASASGLNECLWAPCFLMPATKTHLRTVNPGYLMADIDIGGFRRKLRKGLTGNAGLGVAWG